MALLKKKLINKKNEKHVISLDPEKLEDPNRVKAEKLKIIKKIAATEDLKKLEELNQFDEDKLVTANEWDDVTVNAATKEAFFDGMEIGKREGLCEGFETAESKQQSIRGKKGGEKPKKNKPILIAARQYLEEHPKLVGKTNDQIAERFKKDIRSETPIIVIFNECKWEVYFDNKHIYAEPGKINKRKNTSKSISYATFRNSYISEAKKSIKDTQVK